MPTFGLQGTTVNLEVWDPRLFDPKPEDAKSHHEPGDCIATSFGKAKDLINQKPETLKEESFEDEEYDNVHFLGGGLDWMPFYMVKSGKGFFTPEYHKVKPTVEERRDEILARAKKARQEAEQDNLDLGADLVASSPLSSVDTQELNESDGTGHTVGRSSRRSLTEIPKPLIPKKSQPRNTVDTLLAPRALRIAVKFSRKSFGPMLHTTRKKGTIPDLCVNVFYNGEFQHSRVINDRFKPRTTQQFIVRSFSGRCVGNRIEIPFIMLPPVQQGNEPNDAPELIESNAQRWAKIEENLLAEADKWEASDVEKGKSLMARYLGHISKLKLPSEMEEMQPNGNRRFGVVDVVITAGICSSLKADVATLVLREPRRILARGPIGQAGLVLTVDPEAKTKAAKQKNSIKRKRIARINSGQSPDPPAIPLNPINQIETPIRNTQSSRRVSFASEIPEKQRESEQDHQSDDLHKAVFQSTRSHDNASISQVPETSADEPRVNLARGILKKNPPKNRSGQSTGADIDQSGLADLSISTTAKRGGKPLRTPGGKANEILGKRKRGVLTGKESKEKENVGASEAVEDPQPKRREIVNLRIAPAKLGSLNIAPSPQVLQRRRPSLTKPTSKRKRNGTFEKGIRDSFGLPEEDATGSTSKTSEADTKKLSTRKSARIPQVDGPSEQKKMDSLSILKEDVTGSPSKKRDADTKKLPPSKRRAITSRSAEGDGPSEQGKIGSLTLPKEDVTGSSSQIPKADTEKLSTPKRARRSQGASDRPSEQGKMDSGLPEKDATGSTSKTSEADTKKLSTPKRARRSQGVSDGPSEQGKMDSGLPEKDATGSTSKTSEADTKKLSPTKKAKNVQKVDTKASVDRNAPWKPSPLSDNSVLTFGTEAYNADNYKTDHSTGLICRGALQERETLFETMGILMGVRFVVEG